MATNYGKTCENENYGGMCRIYVDLYRDLLWAVFIDKVPISVLVSELKRILANARSFRTFHHQYNRLLNVHARTNTIKNTDCDISVIYSLFRNVPTTLIQPTSGWGNVPQTGDVLVTDDLERIHHGRNKLTGHPGEASITDADFTAQISDIKDIVTRLDGHLGSSYLPRLLQIESDCKTSKGHLNHYDEYINELNRQQDAEADLRVLVEENKQATREVSSQLDNKVGELDFKTKMDEQEKINSGVQDTLEAHRQERDEDRRRLTAVQDTLAVHSQERDEDRRRLTAGKRRLEEESQEKPKRAKCLSAVSDGLEEEPGVPVPKPKQPTPTKLPDLDELKNYLINTKYKEEILQGEQKVLLQMKDVLQMCAPLEIREDLEGWMALSSMERKPLVNQFMDQIISLELNSFAQIPFLLLILIKSWLNGNRKLENARGFIYSGLIDALLIHSGKNVDYSGTWGHRANTPALPNCFDQRQHCLNYSTLIHELSRLAFDMLFSDEKENSLVFRKHDLAQQLHVKENLTLYLKLGLLTETKGLSETKECQRSFCFPHKSIQEYFSALYLSGEGFETGFERFCERVTSPVEVFAYENVVLFMSGMNPKRCKTLFDYICSIVFCRKFANEDLYPVGWYMRAKVEKIEKLAEQCTAEAKHSVPEGSHTGESQFVIPDMVVDKDTPEHKVRQFFRLGLNIKSLVCTRGNVLNSTTFTPVYVEESIRAMQYIQRLGIVCTRKNSKNYIECICKNLSDLHQLKSFSFSVYVHTIVKLPENVSTELVSKLGTLPNLVSVYLHGLDLPFINTCQFTSQLTSLGLSKTKSLSPGVMSGWCNQLHTLYMYHVDLSPAAVHQLRQYLKTSSSLQSLKLILPCFPNTVFDDVLILTSHTSLHTLELWNMDLKSGVRIHPGHDWRKILLYCVSMSESMCQEFIHTLPTEPLQQLDVDLTDVKSLNAQILSYIRDKFCITMDRSYSDRRLIYFNTKHKATD